MQRKPFKSLSLRFVPNLSRTRMENYSWAWAGLVFFLFGAFFIGRPSLHGAPPVPVVSSDTRWDRMVCAIRGMVESYDGEVGLYIKDLRTGQTFENNADERFVCASLIKLP